MTSNTVIGAPALTCSTRSSAAISAVVGDQLAGDADAFVEAHQMRRGVDMHAQARGLGHRADERAGAALAVGAGDVDDRRQALLGMVEFGQQRAQPVEAEVDQPGMQACEAGDDLFDRASVTRPPGSSLPRSRPMIRASVAFISVRFTTMSMMPCSQQVFGALEALGQLLAHGLLDHARAGEADQRAGLGDLDVAQHGEAGGDAAGGGVGQHDDERQTGVLDQARGDDRARHLHQADRALLHARATRGGEHDQRRLLQHREPGGGDDAPRPPRRPWSRR